MIAGLDSVSGCHYRPSCQAVIGRTKHLQRLLYATHRVFETVQLERKVQQ